MPSLFIDSGMLYAAAPCLFSGVARPQATGLCCPGMFLRFPSCAPSSHRSPLRGFFCPFCGTLPGGGRPGRFPFFSFPPFFFFPRPCPPLRRFPWKKACPGPPGGKGSVLMQKRPVPLRAPLSQKRRARQIPLILRVNSATLEEVKKKPPHVPPLYCGKGTLCEHRQ